MVGAEKEKKEALETGSVVSRVFCFLSDPDPMHPDLLRGPIALPTVTDIRVCYSRPSTTAG